MKKRYVRLKRCPFCNHHELTVDIEEVGYAVRCRECGAMGPSSQTLRFAVCLWNGNAILAGYTSLVTDCRCKHSNRNDTKRIEV